MRFLVAALGVNTIGIFASCSKRSALSRCVIRDAKMISLIEVNAATRSAVKSLRSNSSPCIRRNFNLYIAALAVNSSTLLFS